MKDLGKMKLNKLKKNEMEKKTMKVLKGGRCSCNEACSPVTSISFDAVYTADMYSGY